MRRTFVVPPQETFVQESGEEEWISFCGMVQKKVDYPLTTTKEELHKNCKCLYERGNRNSASHVWVNHLLSHYKDMSNKALKEQAFSFCPVSGSPISGENSYLLRKIPLSEEETAEGAVFLCCWPCICDSQEGVDKKRGEWT